MIIRTIPGPTFRLDSSLPCGCQIRRDEDTKRFRMWYCQTHFAAFEVLEALRSNTAALDHVLQKVGPVNGDVNVADIAAKARETIRKASPGR